ncbi:MAG: hypothetical protein LH617_11405 [Ramlibacter sp.]|nr:hypothetical protein [Ramlibacter sp.]
MLSLHAQMAQDPLLSRTAAVEPNIVFMFDDSGSMPAKAIYQFGGTPGGLGLTGPNNDSFDVMFADQVSFHGRSPDVNRIYYDPRTSYARRIRADSTYLPAGATTGITSFNVYFYKPASSTTYRVNNVPVTARGSGYPAAGVTALFSAPPSGGVRATADVVTATSPKVGAVNVLNGGIGYPTTGVTVTFGPPGAGGVQATGTVTTGNSTTKAVSGVSIVAGGAGYANSTQVVFSDPPAGGVTATGTVTRGGGPRPISTFTLTDPGSGYITPPTVTLTSTGGGVGATFAVTLANVPTRVVTGINVTNGGSGYSAPVPVILNNTGGGSGASFAVTLGTTNVISAINVTNPGSGYVSPPTLALNGTAPGSGEAYTVNTTAIVVQPANMVWDGTGAPTAAANYFTPLYTPDSGSPLAPGAAVLPYPNTAASTTGSYPKFKNRTDCSPATATSCTWPRNSRTMPTGRPITALAWNSQKPASAWRSSRSTRPFAWAGERSIRWPTAVGLIAVCGSTTQPCKAIS